MTIEWKPIEIGQVNFGSIVYIQDPKEPENITENLYIVLDESSIICDRDIDSSIVYVAELWGGKVYKVAIDTEVHIIDAKLVLPQSIKEEING